ncbi:MAG: hypothetical protein EAY81_12320, partial [Bacteroidetes bacterium]
MKPNVLLLALLGLFFSCKKDKDYPAYKSCPISTQWEIGSDDSNFTRYSYNSFGYLNQVSTERIHRKLGASTEFRKYDYYNNGQLARYTYTYKDDNNHRSDNKLSFEYAPSGELIKVNLVGTHGPNRIDSASAIDSIFYDSNEKWYKVKRYSYLAYVQRWELSIEDSLEVDMDGDVTKVFRRDRSKKSYALYTTYEYLNKYKPYQSYEPVLRLFTFFYWKSKKLLKVETQFQLDNGSLFMQSRYEYTFNDLGFPTVVKKENKQYDGYEWASQ